MKHAHAHPWYVRQGLGLALLAICLASLIGQVLVGHAAWNEERADAGLSPLGLVAYLESGHFVSATFENWESEFLQMGMYVLLTVWLRQQGSAESRPLDPAEEEERVAPGVAPAWATVGGWREFLYSNSLAIAFFLLFAASFLAHLDGSWRHELDERAMKGKPAIALWDHFTSSQFWFESFQNWQSEFLSVLAIVVLSIFLRQRNSPQSKPVRAPHHQTGT